MKKMRGSLGVKITAVFLLFLSLIIAVASAFGIAVLAEENAYSDNGGSFRKNVLSGLSELERIQLEAYLQGSLTDNADRSGMYWEKYDAEAYLPENSNYRFVLYDDTGKRVFYTESCENAQAVYDYELNINIYGEEQYVQRRFSSAAAAENYIEQVRQKNLVLDYVIEDAAEEAAAAAGEQQDEWTSLVETKPSEEPYEAVVLELTYQSVTVETFQLHAEIPVELTAHDHIYYTLLWADRFIAARNWIIVIGVAALLFSIVLLVFLLCAAGHKAGVEGIHLNWLDRIPFDLQLAVSGIAAALVPQLFDRPMGDVERIAAPLVTGLIWSALLLAAVLSFASRAKCGAWWRNTLLFRLLHYGKRALLWLWHGMCYVGRRIPLFWKTLVIWLALSILELIFLLNESLPVLWVIEKVLLTPLLIFVVLNLRKLQAGGERVAAGVMEQPVDLRHMLPVFRAHGENLNSINSGMQRAVDARMRSERMKAELITNVSHDIKTPLTSIVNYVDLLKKDGLSSPQAEAYLEVLDRQSARLKKLTEDLIEASKAATGNLSVQLERTDLHVLLSQAAGEYGEKLQERHLELIYDLRAESPFAEADGRLLWRVFDNLFNNICKYALEGTRVYLRTVQDGGQIAIIFLNISRDPLNVSGEELMERFVRGDVSRNTEGSGLGLSIARSLTELQHGTFDISVEGDLFKATLTFPTIP